MPGLADLPLLTAEFLAVDTETNGLARDACELTEVGAVLVGGGELHERWGSLVGVEQPLGRGIQRFTGISQAMVDAAPPPSVVLPGFAEQLKGRVLVAHNARFDTRVLQPGVRARRARVAGAAGALHGRARAPARAAAAPPRAGRAGRRARHRGRRGAPRAARRGDVRARVLRAVPEAVRARGDDRRGARAAAAAARGAQAEERKPERRPVHLRPDMSELPKDPGVYVFRNADGRPLYVGKSVCLRTRARAHFTTPGEWTGDAEHVDYQPTHSELGALVLENRLIKALKPPGNKKLKKTPDGYVYLRCRLDIPLPDPRGRARARAAATASRSGRCAGRPRQRSSSSSSTRCSPCATAGASCRAATIRRPTGRWAAASRPACGTSTRTSTASGSTPRSGSSRARTAAPRCSPTSTARCARRRPSSASSAPPGCGAATRGCGSCSSGSAACMRAIHAGSRLVLAAHPTDAARRDAFWIVGGRVVDWGALPEDPDELAARTADALRAAPRPELGGWLRPDEIAEARIVGLWLAAHEARVHELTPGTDPGVLAARLSGSFCACSLNSPSASRLLASRAPGRSSARASCRPRRAGRRSR